MYFLCLKVCWVDFFFDGVIANGERKKNHSFKLVFGCLSNFKLVMTKKKTIERERGKQILIGWIWPVLSRFVIPCISFILHLMWMWLCLCLAFGIAIDLYYIRCTRLPKTTAHIIRVCLWNNKLSETKAHFSERCNPSHTFTVLCIFTQRNKFAYINDHQNSNLKMNENYVVH